MMVWRADLVAHWVDRLHIGLRGIRQKLNYGCKILLPMCDKKQAAWAAKSRDEGDRRAVRTHSDVNQLAFLRDVLRRKSVQPHALRREDGGTPYARARAPVRSSKSGCVLLLFYFRLFSGRPSMPNEKREKRSIYL